MQKLMGVWRSILITLAIRTANPFNFQWYVEGLPRMCFFAKRDIEKGEELTFDYQWANVMGKKSTKCLCGEENCRGYIEK